MFLFLSQSNSNHGDSLLSLEGYLQLLSSQVENMLEVNEKIQVLPANRLEYSQQLLCFIKYNNHSLPYPLWEFTDKSV